MGSCKILSIICASLTLASQALAQNLPTDLAPRAPPTLMLDVLRFNTVSLRAIWADGADSNGYGLIVGKRGSDLLIATSWHVVNEDGTDISATSVEVTLNEPGGKPLDPRIGSVEPETDLSKGKAADVAFVSVSMAKEHPILEQSLMSGQAEPGDLVWIVQGAQDQLSSAAAGEISAATGDPNTIAFRGGGVSVGTSGSPLVSYGGVLGLVRKSDAGNAYATPMSVVRAQFDSAHANRWVWVAQPRASVPRLGWLRVNRRDQLSTQLQAPLTLESANMRFSVMLNRWEAIPVGTYKLGYLGHSGFIKSIDCDTAPVVIKAWSQRDISLFCTFDPAGTWSADDGSKFRFGPQNIGSHSVVVLNAAGEVTATGTALVNGTELTLSLQSPEFGTSYVKLSLKNEDMVAGSWKQAWKNIERPIALLKD